MGIKKAIKKIGGKAGDAVAKLSVLSPEQLEKVQEKQQEYLSEKPNPTSEESYELTNRWLATNAVEIYNAYLSQLKDLYVPVAETAEYEKAFSAEHNIRFINITKWVIDKKENSLEKLVNVYEVLSNEECNISLIFNRTKAKTNVYMAVTNTKNADNNVDVELFANRIKSAIKGNFSGSEWEEGSTIGTIPCLDNLTSYSVASASNIPTEKSEKFISQTIEKLLDGMIPTTSEEEYTIILLATPVADVEERKLRLTELYSVLAPYSSWSTGFTYDDMDSFGSSATVGVNIGASVGAQAGQNQSVSASDSSSDTISSGEGSSITDSTNHTDGTYANINAGVNISGPVIGGFGASGKGNSTTDGIGQAVGKTVTKGLANTLGKSVGKTVGQTIGNSVGGNFGANFSRTSNVTAIIGKHDSINQTFTNYNIKHTLELLEQQMKRLEKSSALGMWDFGAYVLSEDSNMANNVAHSYMALTQGEESFMSKMAINLWRGDLGEDSNDAKEICKYLKQLRHPTFGLNPEKLNQDPTYNVYPLLVTATTSLSGKELSYSLNFPRKSISGLPVIECAEFGRNVVTYDKKETNGGIKLGKIFHMNHSEMTQVVLDTHSLASHVFITGSTGSGKSNTIYQMLNEAMNKDIHFLVIEPAKGEYKHVFSNDKEVHVYGTNPYLTPLLRLNPFSFPKGIHVLEHIDRLVEIFNVCWPMYAAMPAVLKNAVEVSYEDCGWNLVNSKNEVGEDLYPTFRDVCRNIRTIIDSSDYDQENKGAYKGSLLTRLKSLTNGIYGMIFNQNELSYDELFNQDVILDLSRVGSTETKSLIMGLMVLKLQEYRLSSFEDANQELKHITVLEEAHNLLKRSSMEQSSENGNLLGKSVEMISNAVAEMRTYGEGFIIADQAPGLLDMATIRNTNTKIIMRLPDLGDRELVGHSANLNDDQINELAKLPLGVAAVYQNEWIQPVLCKIEKAHVSKNRYYYVQEKEKEMPSYNEVKLHIATMLSQGYQPKDAELREIKEQLVHMSLDASIILSIIKWLKMPPEEPKMTRLAPMMSALFPQVKATVAKSFKESNNPEEWTYRATEELGKKLSNQMSDEVRRDIIQSIITDYIFIDLQDIRSMERWNQYGNLR